MDPAARAHQRLINRLRRPGAIDVAVAAGALGASLFLLTHSGGPIEHSASQLDLLSGVLAACSTLPLIGWRRAPLAVFVVTGAASAVLAGAGYSFRAPLFGAPPGPTLALYLLAASRDERSPWTWRTTTVAVALFVAYVTATAAAGGLASSRLMHMGLAWAVAWFAGERTRLRREHVAELEARALRAEREAKHERDLAAAEERARLARDLHDSAGHAISVIAVRAGAARLRHDEDPERSRLALEAIEQVARGTVAEIDAILGRLRDNEGHRGIVDAPLGLASVGTLVERHASAGLDVKVHTEGTPRPLEGPVDVAAFRILQEALTNAARHGLGSARVELAFRDTALELTVANRALATGGSRRRGGHGLVGMRERATLLDGTLETERVNGTFRVRARLPYGGSRT